MNKSIDIPVYGWAPSIGALVSAKDAQEAVSAVTEELEVWKKKAGNLEIENRCIQKSLNAYRLF